MSDSSYGVLQRTEKPRGEAARLAAEAEAMKRGETIDMEGHGKGRIINRHHHDPITSASPLAPLAGQKAAVDDQLAAGYKAGRVAGQIDHPLGDVHRLS